MVILSKNIGAIIDWEERNPDGMRLHVLHSESGVLLQRPDSSCAFKVITRKENVPSFETRWIPVTAEEVARVRKHIAAPDTVPHETPPRVRLWFEGSGLHRANQVGTLVAATADSLILKVEGRVAPLRIPVVRVTKIEVSKGKRSRASEGAWIGLYGGALIGGAIGYALLHEEPPYSDGDMGSLGAMIGVTVGGGIGAITGAWMGEANPVDQWEQVPLSAYTQEESK